MHGLQASFFLNFDGFYNDWSIIKTSLYVKRNRINSWITSSFGGLNEDVTKQDKPKESEQVNTSSSLNKDNWCVRTDNNENSLICNVCQEGAKYLKYPSSHAIVISLLPG